MSVRDYAGEGRGLWSADPMRAALALAYFRFTCDLDDEVDSDVGCQILVLDRAKAHPPRACGKPIHQCVVCAADATAFFVERAAIALAEPGATPDIGLAHIQRVSVQRSEGWHRGGLTEWSALEWAGAMAGEAGEAANVAKKIRRIELDVKRRDTEGDLEELRRKLGEECADTLLYLVLLAARCGIDLAAATVAKFNATSAEYRFPERLALAPPISTPADA